MHRIMMITEDGVCHLRTMALAHGAQQYSTVPTLPSPPSPVPAPALTSRRLRGLSSPLLPPASPSSCDCSVVPPSPVIDRKRTAAPPPPSRPRAIDRSADFPGACFTTNTQSACPRQSVDSPCAEPRTGGERESANDRVLQARGGIRKLPAPETCWARNGSRSSSRSG